MFVNLWREKIFNLREVSGLDATKTSKEIRVIFGRRKKTYNFTCGVHKEEQLK